MDQSLARDLGRLSSFPRNRFDHFTRFKQELHGYEQRLALGSLLGARRGWLRTAPEAEVDTVRLVR